MRKEILNCIKRSIRENDEKVQKQSEIQRQKEKVEESIRRSLLKTIEKFFDGLPQGTSYRIHLSEPNDRENPREVTKHIGAITYPVNTFKKHEFEDIGYDIIDIDIRGFSVVIEGFNIGYKYYSRGWDDYGRRNTYHTSWTVKQLQAFVKELDWFEEQIAKEYGCSKEQ